MEQIKLFISYAHADEEDKNTFCKFLATLKRNGAVSEWNDRQLLAGSKLNDEIISQLESSDAVCLLITQDFLASYYCVEEELTRALKMAENNHCRVFPIIVDHCTWLDSEIKEFTCVPTDGQPIKEFANESKGWLQVINELKKLITDITEERAAKVNVENKIEIELCDGALTSEFKDFLNATEIDFQHPHKENITLDDTFVFQDLKVIQDDIDDYEVTRSASTLSDINKLSNFTLILGEEQSGKTSLSKMTYKGLKASGANPVYLDGADLSSSDLHKVISKSLKFQYETMDLGAYLASKENKVLILDNTNEVKLNQKAFERFLDASTELFDHLIILSEDSIQYQEEIISLFDGFEHFEILPMGYERRDKLLRTWYSIGRQEQIQDAELIETVDVATSQLDAIIRKNIVPAKPLFILMIVQALESTQTQDYSLTSHGYCYQILIQENLKKAKIKASEIDKYINYLTHLSYFMYETQQSCLDDAQLKSFQNSYSENYVISSHDEVIQNLILAKLLKESDKGIEVKYRYIFYFYVAKYMADSEDAVSFIDSLCDKLHMEQHSNILIFITHHTRSRKVINKIIERTINIFKDEKEAQLGKEDTEFLRDYLDEIPDLVIKHRSNVLDNRKERFIEKDKVEANKKMTSDPSFDDEVTTISESLRDVARSVRSVEIIGQIIKNRHASIEQKQLNDLAKQAIDVGLRFLSFYLTSTKNIQSELIEIIHKFIEDHSDLSDERIAELSKQSFIQLVYNLSFNVIRKISTSIGHRELIGLFNDLNKDTLTPAYSLINANIQLEFKSNKSSIPRKELEQTWRVLKGEVLAERLLKASVLQFQYLNFVGYKDKAWISEKLGIPLEVQDKFAGNKQTKKLSKR